MYRLVKDMGRGETVKLDRREPETEAADGPPLTGSAATAAIGSAASRTLESE